MRGGLVTAVLLLGAAQAVGAQRLELTTGDVSLRLSGRVQIQFSTSSVSDEEAEERVVASTFETRRVRLAAILAIGDRLTGMLQPDFAGSRTELRNAWVQYALTDAFGLRTGQYKKPFSRIELESSTTVHAIERGVRVRGLTEAWAAAEGTPDQVLTRFGGEPLVGDEYELLSELGYAGYELGASAFGSVGPFSWEAGVFNGSGAATPDNNDAKSFAARGAYALGGATPATIGAAVSHHETSDEVDGTAYELDFEWGEFRRPGLHVITELASGSTIGTDASFLGAQAMMAWFRPIESEHAEGFELVGRVSYGDPNTDTGEDAGTLFTPGVTLYFQGRNRLMLNWDVFVPQGNRFDTQHALRAQAQLHF